MNLRKEQLQQLVEKLPDAFAYHKIVTDNDGKPTDYIFLEVNKSFEEMTGLSKERIIGRKVTEVLPGIEDSEFDWIGTYGRVALEGDNIRFEDYSEPLDRWYDVEAYSEKPEYFAVVFRDITENKKMEEDLNINNKKLNNILNNINDGVWSLTWPDFKILFLSPSVEKIYGYSEQEFQEDPNLWQNVTHPEDQSITEKAFHQLQKNGVAERECRIIRPDGTIRWIHDKSQLIYDDNNNPIRVGGVCRDITERKQTENILQEYKERLAQAQTFSKAGTWEYDVNNESLYWSKECEALFGLKEGEFEGTFDAFLKRVHPDDRDYIITKNQSIVEDKEAINLKYEHRIIHEDGTVRWVRESAGVVSSEKGEKIVGFVMDITEQKKKVKQLQESEQLLNTLISNTPAVIYFYKLINGTPQFTYVSENVKNVLGFDPEYFIDNLESIKECIHPEDTDKVFNNAIDKLLTGEHRGKTILKEFRLKDKDGKYHWVHDEQNLISHEDGIQEIVGTWWDITERKRAEAEIKSARNQYQSLVDNIPGITYRCKLDKHWTMLYMSDMVVPLTGYPADDFMHNAVRTYESVIHPEDIVFVKQRIEKAVAEGRQWDIEYRVFHKDGDIRWVHEKGRGVFSEGDKEVFLDGFILDITERKKRENELATLQQRINVAKEVSGLGIWENNFQKNETYTDKQWIRLHGGKAESYEDFLSLVHPEDRERVDEAVQKVLEKDEGFNFEYRTIIEDELRWISSYGTIIRDREGKPKKMIVSVIDITDQKDREQQLKKTLSEKETLLKEVHHRVKNNLQVICSLLRLQKLEIEDEASPRVLEAFETSRGRVLSMAEVHNQIYQTDHLAGVDTESYLRDLTNGIIKTRKVLLAPTVKFDVDSDVNLEIDEAIHIGLILNELLTNALEHAFEDDEKSQEITIEFICENDKYCLRVADNGCGLDPDFDLSDTSSLGLQLVQSLAEDQLGGKLNINVNDGTEFEIRFPA